jgi:hypothetical protein
MITREQNEAMLAVLRGIPRGSRLKIRYVPENCPGPIDYEGDLLSVGECRALGHPTFNARVATGTRTFACLDGRLLGLEIVRLGAAEKSIRRREKRPVQDVTRPAPTAAEIQAAYENAMGRS